MEFTLANGEKLYYESIGAGEPVVFLHGWLCSSDVFRKTAEVLSPSRRCILLDQRGHFRSRAACSGDGTVASLAADLDELIRGLDLRGATLAGWSMGAAAAMEYLRRYGTGRVRRAALIDMAPRSSNGDGWRLGLMSGAYTDADAESDRALGETDFLGFCTAFSLRTTPELRTFPPQQARELVRESVDQCDERMLRLLCQDVLRCDWRAMLPDFPLPLLYCYADPGSLYSPALAEYYQNTVPRCRCVRFAGASHMLPLEQPVPLGKALKTWLEEENE